MASVGSWMYTPIFNTVVIERIFESNAEAVANGYTIPTCPEEFLGGEYEIRGMQNGCTRMSFAIVKRGA